VPVVVDAAPEVDATAEALARAPLVAFDLEFVTRDRLVPQLCLVQVAWSDVGSDAPEAAIVASPPQVRLVDPLAVDVAPIVHALAAHPLAIVHAPRQDLAVIAARFGVAMPNVFDTQLAAAFCGIGDQVGLASLAADLLGVALAKELQWTDWATRPLSPAHLDYADADVRHLPAMYARLAARLGRRVAWVREESAAIAAEAVRAANLAPEDAWQNVGGVRALDAGARARVVELAAWRQRVAVALDRPLPQILADRALVELARAHPDRADAVRATRGLSEHARRRAEEIVAALAAARPDANRAPQRGGAGVRAQRWAEILYTIAQVVAEETRIAARLLATRGDAEEFARVVDEGGLQAAEPLPALASWRREMLGTAWLGWLGGTVVLVGDAAAPHGVRLVPR
jgi:ribonuclease D